MLAPDPSFETAMTIVKLDANTVVQDTLCLAVLLENLGETPHARCIDLLAPSNLVLRTTKSLQSMLLDTLTAANRGENLANLDASDSAVGLAESTTHTGLKTISTGAGKHFVDAQHVEGMHTNAHVEGVLPCTLRHVLVACNTARLECLGGHLLQLIRSKMSTEGEVVDRRLLAAQIVDTDLGVRHTTAVARLDVRLVLLVAVALGRATTHGGLCEPH